LRVNPYRVFGVVGAEPLHGAEPHLRKGFMELTVKLVSDKVEERKIEVANGDTYERVLEKLNVNPEEVVVLRNGKPVPEDEEVVVKRGVQEEITIRRIIAEG